MLPGGGGDPLGVVSRKDARAERGSGSGPVLSRLLLLLLRGINHVAVLVFFVVWVVRLGLAVRARALRRGTHEGLLRVRVRVLHEERRGREVLVGDVRGGT